MESPSRRDVFAIVRAYNEAPTIGAVVSEILAAGYSALVVDDGSTDDTASVVRGLAAHMVRHPINVGPGAALQTGLTAALRLGARLLVTLDADGQHPCSEVARCLVPLETGEADVVFGSRFLRPEDRKAVPLPRQMLLLGGILVNGMLTGLWLTDAHNGFRAFTREAAERIRLREEGFAYASEMLSEIQRHALRVIEIPVHVRYSERTLAKGQQGANAINVLIDVLTDKVLR